MQRSIAHANIKKYQRFKEWMSFPPSAAIMQVCFNMILGHVLQAIIYIANVNVKSVSAARCYQTNAYEVPLNR
jgi:hypothetical protein